MPVLHVYLDAISNSNVDNGEGTDVNDMFFNSALLCGI